MKKVSEKKLINIISKYDIVSFDLFGTLIKRYCSSTQIFEVVEKKFDREFKKNSNFKKIRIAAEKKARKNCIDNKYGEISIDDIYLNIDEFNKKELEFLKKCEITTELDFCVFNNDIINLYKYCIKNDKKIIITSDMYLKKKHIEKIIRKNGIKYDKLYLSNELKLNKRYGKLFDFIISDLNITNKKIVHIGDSKRNDFIIPKLKGIKSVLIPTNYYNDLKYFDSGKKDKTFDYFCLQSFINNNILNFDDFFTKLGYEIIGPLLYGYTFWLKKELDKNNIKKVFFLSREGKILLDAFNIINDKKINCKYFFASRKSIRECNLGKINNYDDFKAIVRLNRNENIYNLFLNAGLSLNDFEMFLEDFNINLKDEINKNSIELFNKLIPIINKKSNQKMKVLLEYLYQEGVNGKFAICDVGWVGTMQKSIYDILTKNNISFEQYGFYVGQSSVLNECINHNNKMNNYLAVDNYYKYEQIYPFLNLFESFFLANHGTTIGYIKKGKKIFPQLAKYEYNHTVSDIYRKIQNGAISFVNDFNISELKNNIKMTPEITLTGLLKLGLTPTKDDINIFCNINYTETTTHKFVENAPLLYYVFNIKKFKEDFLNSRWKIGFLKCTFKINFINYYKLYMFLKKIKGE